MTDEDEHAQTGPRENLLCSLFLHQTESRRILAEPQENAVGLLTLRSRATYWRHTPWKVGLSASRLLAFRRV